MFDFIVKYRRPIIIMERNGLSWPNLTDYYFTTRSKYIHKIAKYLEKGIKQGMIRALKDTQLSARLILECIAWFAMHRYHDRDLHALDDERAADTVVDAMVHAFHKERT